ncbi:MAG TPA: hypothetical protein VGX25_03995 [Actinophytocola sp.]|uniref:hypothetical protein n=1 Tax=Actinophytocola sp. TaxID=1872138 RepID=UPI002DDD926F|nr:hypothetical protein [Actinophytocola sp.]HEV2778540.1 hypothetical protein [Actinophytocola sp.]
MATTVVTAAARAYVNHGRWLADCPRPHCGNAMLLQFQPRQELFHCGGLGGCQLVTPVDWPIDAEAITAVLALRPVPVTRNWAPAGHRQSVTTGTPDGQTVIDLLEENVEHGVISWGDER